MTKRDWNSLFGDVEARIKSLERAIATSDGFPIEENLLPESLYVTPAETPVLNRLRVVPGYGEAAAWKEITDVGASGAATMFYAEGGEPEDTKPTWVPRSESYKLMGKKFGVTGFARAAGGSFGDMLIKARQNAIVALKLDIEWALINADGTGNAFTGLVSQITAGNGAYVQAIGGALALDDLADALQASWDAGFQVNFMVMNSLQAKQISDLVLAAGTHAITVLRDQQSMVHGMGRVTHIIDPVSGVAIDVIPSRSLAAGTILGVPEKLPMPVPGDQGRAGLWWDELQGMTEMEVGVVADAYERYLKTYATLAFPARRGAFKLTGIT